MEGYATCHMAMSKLNVIARMKLRRTECYRTQLSEVIGLSS
jgi:hypothetical protein